MDSGIKFPCVMKSTHTGLLIKATGFTMYKDRSYRFAGTVISRAHGCSIHDVGDTRDDWCVEVFEPFEPIIIKIKE
jgi:hypothetical protein